MRTVLVYLTLGVLTIVFGLLVLVAGLFGARPKPGGFLERVPRIFSRAVIRASGSRIRINNPERIAHGEARLYLSNHVSWFDVFALAAILSRYRYIAKRELSRIPIFGPAAGRIAAIYIDRKNRKAAFESYRAAAAQMRTGLSVVVYPEGTRGWSYALRPFKKGPFVLAITAQAPIVPVVVHGTREIQPKGAARVRAGEVEVTLLEPIPTAGLTYEDRDALMRTVWERMAAELERRHGVRSEGAAIDTRAGAG